jgi:DNA (cytosine-5)-methyltransferase 1
VSDKKQLTFGSLFAGIGGFDLGFERAGMVCKWQVEIDDYAQRVLAKHWPDVRRHDDVRTFPPSAADDWRVDVICGGFPCQDISTANSNRTGLDGERSGLWREYQRIVCILRPRYVVVENVANLSVLGLHQVLADFASVGFDAEWATIPASMFGAPHSRKRVFVVAYPCRERREVFLRHDETTRREAASFREWQPRASTTRCDVLRKFEQSVCESSILGSRDGIPDIMDRLKCVGNAVVPQVAEWIGRRIVEAEAKAELTP